MPVRSRLITIGIIVIGFGIIVNLSRSIYTTWQKGERIRKRQFAYETAQQENLQLRRKLAEVKSPEYVEKQAREKLGLAKEGEQVVILPEELQSQDVLEAHNENGSYEHNIPNWRQWWELFF